MGYNEGGVWRERIGLFGSVAVAIAIAAGSIAVAVWRCEPHWVNRGGAAIVAIQAIAAIAEYARRERLRSLRLEEIVTWETELGSETETSRRAITSLLQSEIGKSERQALGIVLGLAAVGEILHGFGDLFLETVSAYLHG